MCRIPELLPRDAVRAASTSPAPRRAAMRAVTRPIPEVAPVMTVLLTQIPECSCHGRVIPSVPSLCGHTAFPGRSLRPKTLFQLASGESEPVRLLQHCSHAKKLVRHTGEMFIGDRHRSFQRDRRDLVREVEDRRPARLRPAVLACLASAVVEAAFRPSRLSAVKVAFERRGEGFGAPPACPFW